VLILIQPHTGRSKVYISNPVPERLGTKSRFSIGNSRYSVAFRLESGVSLAERVPSLFAVIGPTASGKSAFAHALAKRVGGEILCVDSMTVYRGMDIGTAKPSQADRTEVRHHLIDAVDPSESFTVAQFVALADAVIVDARARGTPLVAVGGTPMYFKALFEGLFEGPGADESLRETLMQRPVTELADEVRRIDPAAALRIESNDQRRLIRAIEVYRLTGKPITQHQKEWGNQVRHPATWVGLRWEKEALNRRINARVKHMFADGWLDEVRQLIAKYGPLSKTAGLATGYAQLTAHLDGKMSLDEAFEQTKIATRQLASRQMKWFRRFTNVQWIEGGIDHDASLERLCQSAS
jgi:tRNA dimethylallyltransferase